MNEEVNTKQSSALWLEVLAGENSTDILTKSMEHVARNLGMMLGTPLEIQSPKLEAVPLSNVVHYGGRSPEAETVGVYLLIEGDLQGQSLLVFDLEDALYLVDLLMDSPPGSTTELDSLARSAIAEIGNLSLSSFLNIVSDRTGRSIVPSPPAVIIDMAAAILQTVAANSVSPTSDKLIVLNSTLKDAERTIKAQFWVLPDPDTNIFDQFQKSNAQ